MRVLYDYIEARASMIYKLMFFAANETRRRTHARDYQLSFFFDAE